MKLWVCLLTCLILALVALPAMAADDPSTLSTPSASSGQAEDDDDDDDDDTTEDEDEEEENPWGEAELDHELNLGWDYPEDYIARPLVLSRRVTELGVNFSFKESRHYYDEDGNLVEGDFHIKKQTMSLGLGMGFTDRWSVSIRFPFVYKKTVITDPERNQNYRIDRENTYGALFEEAIVDYLDNHELWMLWEADLPTLGDVELWSGYSLYQNLEPRTTSLIAEIVYKAPTGNDNPRRGSNVRNYLTTGTPDFTLGLAAKQQLWRFSGELHAGYKFRMKANTKYAAGTVDLADQVLVDAEIAVQPGEAKPLWDSLALMTEIHYMTRVNDSRLLDNKGNKMVMDDAPGYLLSIEPKFVCQGLWPLKIIYSGEIVGSMDIPIAGQKSFLPHSRSSYLPPWELESYESVGITYNFALVKRWQ